MRVTRSPSFWFVAIAGLIFGLRCILTLSSDGFLGIDGGAYLLSRNAVLGQEMTGTDFPRPPLAPGWLLVPTTALFGDVMGYNLYAAIFSMPLLIAVWIVAKSLLKPWHALAVVVLVGLDWLLTTMVVTGVVPMVGFTFLLLSLWAMWQINTHGAQPRYVATLIICVPMIAFTNQTSAGLAALLLPLNWLLMPNRRAITVPLLLAGVASLTALPWYLGVSPASGKLAYPGFLVVPHNIWEHQLWIGVITLYVMRNALKRLSTVPSAPVGIKAAICIAGFLAFIQMFASFNEVLMNIFFRSTYLMMPFVWIVVVWMFQTGGAMAWTPALRRIAAVGVVALALVSVHQFQEQSSLSSLADGPVVRAMAAIPAGQGAVVTNSYNMALYVAAGTQRPVKWTNYIAPPPYYAQDAYEAGCTMGWRVGECAASPDVAYVLVNTAWPPEAVGFAPAELLYPYGAPERKPWHIMDTLEWLELVYEEGTVKLYEVKG